ncbi:hypothetical protein HHK36_032045 [Tetracentron sinense]|uniref:Calponin-homology (CH) domain-containing protein n=1 Tax=Tetracentron sinense TaxID=13715 RepID=A0A835CXI1_TETSI|nr:hypothetical protein HHK36_032045 [Tetracentron sinense]
MNSLSDHTNENGRSNSSNEAVTEDGKLIINTEAKQRADLVQWINGMLPYLSLPLEASEEELRACLIDGTVLCSILNRLNPGFVDEGGSSVISLEPHLDNVKRFLAAINVMGLPKFERSDLEQGSMTKVLDCLLTLRSQFNSNVRGDHIHIPTIANSGNHSKKKWKLSEVERLEGTNGSLRDVSSRGHHSTVSEEEKRKSLSDSKFQRVLRSPVMSEPSAALIHHVGHKFHEVFQLKQGRYADLPAAKISEMMKSNSLDASS